jgi:hypothetical protein
MIGFRFPAEAIIGIFFLATASRPDLGPNQPPIQCVLEVLTPVVKRSGREADHHLEPRLRMRPAILPFIPTLRPQDVELN